MTQQVKDPAFVTAVAQVRFPAREILHGVGMAKNKHIRKVRLGDKNHTSRILSGTLIVYSAVLTPKFSCELFSLMILSSQASLKVHFRENKRGPRPGRESLIWVGRRSFTVQWSEFHAFSRNSQPRIHHMGKSGGVSAWVSEFRWWRRQRDQGTTSAPCTAGPDWDSLTISTWSEMAMTQRVRDSQGPSHPRLLHLYLLDHLCITGSQVLVSFIG